jgi:TatD DNase family protein
MLTDAHCHPIDLLRVFAKAEEELIQLEVLTAASACFENEHSFNVRFAYNTSSLRQTAAILPCYGIHPQLPAVETANGGFLTEKDIVSHLEVLERLAAAGAIAAIGECGFDLFNDAYKETEKVQEWIFTPHLEAAIHYDLPLVLHVRRAMHKIFAEKSLSKCKAVIFHSWQGSYEDAVSLLRRGINAYFSFGNIILLNHKKAIRSCSFLPADRLLTETDAPYQPRRGEKFSSWLDLPLILNAAAAMRSEDAKNLEQQIENNFRTAFNYSS